MLFNSFEFPIFLAIVFLLYWFVFKQIKAQNILIIVASYVFYGWWDWRFLSLIILSSMTDYLIGIALSKENHEKKRKLLLGVSILVNIGLLCFFKYYNFFIDSFVDMFSFFGHEVRGRTLNIILPVGISFYTFQTLSYTIDVYWRKIEPTKDIFSFFAFVSFFPQLVAGPIERAKNLLPQFYVERQFNLSNAKDGLRQILWGLAKKLFIADNCGMIVNEIFDAYTEMSPIMLLIGVLFFAVQMYGDFSGYSDVAIGTARLFGFNLLANFHFPYFAKSTADLWRRWHISLNVWANSYVFVPLTMAYSKYKKKAIVGSIIVTFVIIGIWHGANWKYALFGLWHGIFASIEYLTLKRRKKLIKKYGAFFTYSGWLVTILIWLVGMLIFRAESIALGWDYFTRFFDNPYKLEIPRMGILEVGFYCSIFFLVEWLQRNKEHALDIAKLNQYLRWPIYILLGTLVVNGIFGGSEEFIYFQF